MALSGAVLKASLKANLLATGKAVDDAVLDEIIGVIADTVVNHITTYAVVTVPAGVAVLCSPYPGATTAPGVGTIA